MRRALAVIFTYNLQTLRKDNLEVIMSRKTILLIIWLAFELSDYFLLPYFVKPFSWILVCLVLLFLSIKYGIKVIKQRKQLDTNRVLSFLISIGLLFLTFYNINLIPTLIIERIDWSISYKKRNQIVADVEAGKLNSNKELKNGICELPYNFPIVSNGGNDIWIFENKVTHTKTIKFWIARGFFESPQTYFIYTNDSEAKNIYQKQIRDKPEYNRKLEENWYRIMERD
jgi:hypothetical protein